MGIQPVNAEWAVYQAKVFMKFFKDVGHAATILERL